MLPVVKADELVKVKAASGPVWKLEGNVNDVFAVRRSKDNGNDEEEIRDRTSNATVYNLNCTMRNPRKIS